MPVIPATWEAEEKRSREPERGTPNSMSEIVPLHSSLGDSEGLSQGKKNSQGIL